MDLHTNGAYMRSRFLARSRTYVDNVFTLSPDNGDLIEGTFNTETNA